MSDSFHEDAWNHRDEPLPRAGTIWASDGKRVWLVAWRSAGPIPASATNVLFWAYADVPLPPSEHGDPPEYRETSDGGR